MRRQVSDEVRLMEQQATITIEENMIRCGGAWTLPNLAQLERRGRMVRWPESPTILCDLGEVNAMDTGGALMLLYARLMAFSKKLGVSFVIMRS